jgi:phospholipid transport system substrate-binding protein
MNTKHNLNPIFSAILALFLSFIPLTAFALSAPQVGIEKASNQLKVKMQAPGFTKDFQQITVFVESEINPHIDFDHISRAVLGLSWNNATDDEKVRFQQAFKTLLIRFYSRAFVEFKDWSIRYFKLNMEPNATKVLVRTEVLQPNKAATSVNYKMHLVEGQWKVYDIMIEGISLVANYRTSFKNQMARLNSVAALIDFLNKKINKTALVNAKP